MRSAGSGSEVAYGWAVGPGRHELRARIRGGLTALEVGATVALAIGLVVALTAIEIWGAPRPSHRDGDSHPLLRQGRQQTQGIDGLAAPRGP